MTESESTCRHCGDRIILVNYALGPQWTHQPAGSSFLDNTQSFCAHTTAEPVEEKTDD